MTICLDTCPICNRIEDIHTRRYKNCVCFECREKYIPLTEYGDKISFGNIDICGGFKSIVNGKETIDPIDICYINGLKCRAVEARYGGIVIMKYN